MHTGVPALPAGVVNARTGNANRAPDALTTNGDVRAANTQGQRRAMLGDVEGQAGRDVNTPENADVTHAVIVASAGVYCRLL